jgi:hypothetical protein
MKLLPNLDLKITLKENQKTISNLKEYFINA